MNNLPESLFRRPDESRARRVVDRPWVLACVGFMLVLGYQAPWLLAQKRFQQGAPQQAVGATRKLPSAEKVVDSYLKAVGGKKRVATIRDATYEWTIQLKAQTMGTAKTLTKIPSSVRTEMIFGNGQLTSGANGRSAWKRGLVGELQTLTDAEAAAARLQAMLDASHLVDVKKSNVLARVISVKNVGNDAAYVVEFSLRSGARLRYLFSTATKLLLSIEDDARQTTTRFEDYRPEGTMVEPHRVIINNAGTGN